MSPLETLSLFGSQNNPLSFIFYLPEWPIISSSQPQFPNVGMPQSQAWSWDFLFHVYSFLLWDYQMFCIKYHIYAKDFLIYIPTHLPFSLSFSFQLQIHIFRNLLTSLFEYLISISQTSCPKPTLSFPQTSNFWLLKNHAVFLIHFLLYFTDD